MTAGKLTIVAVDSGVDQRHPFIAPYRIEGFSLSHNRRSEDFTDTFGHGTAICAILSSVSDFASIINIKIPDIEKGIDESELLAALTYIAENVPCDLLNLSFGLNVCQEERRLYEICTSLNQRGTVILSAFDNAGSLSYPAAFDNVIGVYSSNRCQTIHDFEYMEDDVVNIGGFGGIQRLAWCNPPYIFTGGNSFACAHATVRAAKLLHAKPQGFSELLTAFKEGAVYTIPCRNSTAATTRAFTICKAAVCPFNKEMHSLLRFAESLSFEITDVYDTRRSMNIGRTTSHVLNIQDHPFNHCIKNIEDIQYDSIDTLILGHTSDIGNTEKQHQFYGEIVRSAVEHGKFVYCLDYFPELQEYYQQGIIFTPVVTRGDLPPRRNGKLYRIGKPVLGVFGTSAKQGKFTLQIVLRNRLMDIGYTVGQIGTEPTALLFDMDYVFPVGYHSTVDIYGQDCIRYLNQCIHRLCEKDKDIILVGAQSGTVPYDTGNMEQYPVEQYMFLMGTQPDAVVLTVNPYDEAAYIERTIRYIESAVICKVIALVLFPMDVQRTWFMQMGLKKPLDVQRQTDIQHTLEERFGIPLYVLGNPEHEAALVEHVINFFS